MRRWQRHEAAHPAVAHGDGPALGGGPHRAAAADVEGLAAPPDQVADDPAITRQPPQGLGGDGTATQDPRSCPEAVGHDVHLGHQVQGGAGAGRSLPPHQRHQGVGPLLAGG